MKRFLALILVLVPLFVSSCRNEEEGVLYINGRIEGDEYDVATKYAGKVEKVFVDEGDEIKKGEILALLDSKEVRARREAAEKAYQGALKEAEALKKEVELLKEKLAAQREKLRELEREVSLSIKVSKEKLKRAKASLKGALAQKYRAESTLEKVKKDYERFKRLYERRVISKSRYEEALLRLREAESGYKSAEAAVEGARALIKEAEKGVKLAQNRKREIEALKREIRATERSIEAKEELYRGALNRAKSLKGSLEEVEAVLENLKITSPINGVVSEKMVEPGEVVGAGARLFTLYDLNKLYFEGYVPESKVGLLHVGQKGYLVVDAYPKRKFPVVLTYVSTRAEFTPKEVQTKEERVKQVFKVKLRLIENPKFVLKPGMPADCYLEVKE